MQVIIINVEALLRRGAAIAPKYGMEQAAIGGGLLGLGDDHHNLGVGLAFLEQPANRPEIQDLLYPPARKESPADRQSVLIVEKTHWSNHFPQPVRSTPS